MGTTYRKQIAYIPKNSGGWSVTWENPWCNVVWHATASGERWSTNGENAATHIDAYTDMGLALYRDLLWGSKTISLRGDVLNIFDKQYEVVRRYPMPGRLFKFTFGIKF
jgi:outer membrane receptor protein involved in Fe transport